MSLQVGQYPDFSNPAGIGRNGGPEVDINDASWHVFFDEDGVYRFSPYKILHGGRGGGKSWDVAIMLISRANAGTERILCCREYMNSIADSSHKLLVDMIYMMNLQNRFTITQNAIRCHATGSEFIFKGLNKAIMEIKSTEGITLCWVEEAEPVSADHWKILIPTVFRRATSEIWITFNPNSVRGATYQQFVARPKLAANDNGESLVDYETNDRFVVRNAVTGRPEMIVAKVGWEDNHQFPEGLERERAKCERQAPEDYDWVWGGEPRKITDAVIFKRRVKFEAFEEPVGIRPLYGLDWGFADDPLACIRFYEKHDALTDTTDLFITHEAFGHRVELDEIPEFLDLRIPGIREWPIKADSAQPSMISHVRNKGFNIDGAEKWPGSVEDGISHLKAYRNIYVHPRCPKITEEFQQYSYKVDKKHVDEDGRPEILPEVVDKFNHGIDAVRYGLDGEIQNAGGMGVWGKLAG